MSLVHCYNKGCGQKFDPDNNIEDACRFHPGPPYFHDAQKIWQCCDKKSTDFGTWMSIPGCQYGKHSTEKPVDVVRMTAQMQIRPEKEDEVIVWNGLNKPAERPNDENGDKKKFAELDKKPAGGLAAAILKFKEAQKTKEAEELKVGSKCTNSGCEHEYAGPDCLQKEDCQHHPGAPIFHEGMKYYSCCKKKTSNFNAFLEQKGCAKGNHKFSKTDDKLEKFREDWYCRGGNVYYNIYCLGPIPEDCKFECDGLTLKARVTYAYGDKEKEIEMDLFGQVLPHESQVLIAERKVEVVLKQADNLSWPQLKYSA